MRTQATDVAMDAMIRVHLHPTYCAMNPPGSDAMCGFDAKKKKTVREWLNWAKKEKS
jgi:hypothetical protein